MEKAYVLIIFIVKDEKFEINRVFISSERFPTQSFSCLTLEWFFVERETFHEARKEAISTIAAYFSFDLLPYKNLFNYLEDDLKLNVKKLIEDIKNEDYCDL